MCKLSHQLKMCICDVPDVSELEHYWVLHRFNPKKDMVIGRVARPDTLDVRVDAYNRSLLLQRLHEDDAFDIDLNLQNGDRSQLTFRCSEPDASGQPEIKVITYGYARRVRRKARNARRAFQPIAPGAVMRSAARAAHCPCLLTA